MNGLLLILIIDILLLQEFNDSFEKYFTETMLCKMYMDTPWPCQLYRLFSRQKNPYSTNEDHILNTYIHTLHTLTNFISASGSIGSLRLLTCMIANLLVVADCIQVPLWI